MLLKIRKIAIILSIVVVSFGIGYNVGNGKIINGRTKLSPATTSDNGWLPFSLEPKQPASVDLKLFWDVWERLRVSYIDKSKLDPQRMVFGAIQGMVSSLEDPYTVFLTPTQNTETKEELGGTFDGIGAQLGIKDKKIVVVAPLSGSPAAKAGVRSGDFIYKVDGKETFGLTLPEAVSKIRGKKGTKVVLTITREKIEKPFDITVVRDTILVKSVEWEEKTLNGTKFYYLKLSRFGDNTDSEWDKAVSGIKSAMKNNGNSAGLVLDLRNNPGGYFSSAIYTASEFLSGGVVAKQQNADGSVVESKVARNGNLIDTPIVVLINKGSASAAEILAGALSDRGRAKLVGETSFGKGSVQERQELSGGSGLHVTIAKWLLPSGKWINGSGLTPDFPVSEDEKDPTNDLQLSKAVEVLRANR